MIIEDKIETSPTSCRYTESVFATDGSFYKLDDHVEYSIGLELFKPKPKRSEIAMKRSVQLENLVHFSSSYGKRCWRFLILGKTDKDYMQALIIPENDCAPELKSIPLTWSEARAILDKKWEDKFGSADSDISSDTSSDIIHEVSEDSDLDSDVHSGLDSDEDLDQE